jgi:hypothetical protein
MFTIILVLNPKNYRVEISFSSEFTFTLIKYK